MVTGFEASEESFDLPTVRIGLNGLGLGRLGTGDDQEFTILEV